MGFHMNLRLTRKINLPLWLNLRKGTQKCEYSFTNSKQSIPSLNARKAIKEEPQQTKLYLLKDFKQPIF